LVAFDSFKDALSAERACEVAAGALTSVDPAIEVDCAPLSDGGEGFARVLTLAAGGRLLPIVVAGPKFQPVEASIGLVEPGRLPAKAREILFGRQDSLPTAPVAVIEMASASGLPLLSEAQRNPWLTSSRGTGDLIRTATEMGVSLIVLGIGGSATSDLGLGALEALGLRFVDEAGSAVDALTPERWTQIARIDGAIIAGLPPIAVACDVRNPLLGPDGAAAIYGPQKGLPDSDFARFDELAGNMARLLCEKCEANVAEAVSVPGAGAAGGLSFGLGVATGAQLVPGFDLVSAWLGLEARIAAADIVISGEGRFDATSFAGKAVGRIVSTARKLNRRCIVFAGSIEVGSAEGEERVGISPQGVPLPEALSRTAGNLRRAVGDCFANRR
jgi:glycerate kinase